MPVEFLSEGQVARFARFEADPSPVELEWFFRLDGSAWRLVAGKRRDENRLGFAVQWGTVRMLGAFLGENPTAVPPGVVAFVCEQLGIADSSCLGAYAERSKTAYEHQWEIRRSAVIASSPQASGSCGRLWRRGRGRVRTGRGRCLIGRCCG